MLFKAKCLKCDGGMVIVDTTDYDDTFHCERCKYSVEIRPRNEKCNYNIEAKPRYD